MPWDAGHRFIVKRIGGNVSATLIDGVCRVCLGKSRDALEGRHGIGFFAYFPGAHHGEPGNDNEDGDGDQQLSQRESAAAGGI